MKKLISILTLVLVAIGIQAQIHQPVTWTFKLNDSNTAEKAIIFTATAEDGWHLYDQNLPEGGPVSTSFNFETLKGAELVGKPISSIKPTVVYDELFAMELRWYPGTVSFTQKIKVTDPAKFEAAGEIEFMACNDETCLPPERVEFAFNKSQISATTAATTNTPEPIASEEILAENKEVPTTSTPEKKHTEKAVSSPATVSGELTNRSDLWTPVIDK